jgi:hypothetical protein
MAESGPARAHCAEKETLHHQYIVSVSDYQRAVAVLGENLGTLKKPEYSILRKYIEDARKASEQARSMLDRHIAEHGC